MITKEMTIRDVLVIDRINASIIMAYGMHCMGWRAWKWAAPPTAAM